MSRTVGIDLGLRTKHRAAIFDGATPRGKPFSVDVSREGFDQLVGRATEQCDGPVHFVMEPTGLAWLPLAAFVASQGHQVSLSKPQKVSDLRKFYRKYTKSDAIDAATLGRLPHIDPQGVHRLAIPTPQQLAMRRLVNRYERLKREAADQKRRVHALMTLANPFLMEALGENKFGQAAVAFLRQYADPDKVVKLGLSRLKAFWNRHTRGSAKDERVKLVFEACRKAKELFSPLRQQNALPFDFDDISEELNFELDRMAQAEAEATKVDAKVQAIYSAIDPERTLEQIKGIGPVIAAALTALVGDISRFSNGSKFVSYCGLCPRKKQSGVTDTPMPITKTGQRLLKKYLYCAADIARQWDPEFAAYYARRYVRGDHHNAIVIALARKMAWRVYALLKRRIRAQQQDESDPQVTPVRFVLRTPDGREVESKEARKIIQTTYARDVVAPGRTRRQRTDKTQDRESGKNGKGGKDSGSPQSAAREWPPQSDATSCVKAAVAQPRTDTIDAELGVKGTVNRILEEIQGRNDVS